MDSKPETIDALAALRHLTLEEVAHRIAEIDGERASLSLSLSLLRRSLVARKRARQRSERRSVTNTEARRDD